MYHKHNCYRAEYTKHRVGMVLHDYMASLYICWSIHGKRWETKPKKDMNMPNMGNILHITHVIWLSRGAPQTHTHVHKVAKQNDVANHKSGYEQHI
jgi:hypothetical protein